MNQNNKQTAILLVEDDAALGMGLEYALQSEGYIVRSAGNLTEARKEVFTRQFEPDLIILDVMLPDGTGYDFCREAANWRKNRSLHPWPVIFLSACDSEANIVMGLDGGGDDYITKPFRIRELISRVQAVLRRRENTITPANDTIISCGPVKVDLQDYRVWLQDEELTLTVMEFRLLSCLIRNRGRIVSRQLLLQTLWDDRGEYIDDNTLSVHISHLRDKLESGKDLPQLIQTVRGVGYRFCPEEE
jgi:DNA-binding response OmpR family regulator